MTTRIVFTDKEQFDLAEAQALSDSAVDNIFEAVDKLLFSGDYRIEGGTVIPHSPPSGVVLIEPGIFTRAGGKFYSMGSQATANILTGVDNPAGDVWGTGQAANATNPRLDIIVVTFQEILGSPNLKNFINDTVDPPVSYTQTVSTRKTGAPLFSVLHGVPSATPTEPAIPSGFMKIATVRVAAGATVINTGDITNNLNINLKSLEQLQFGSQPTSAFSDLLHGHGVYSGVLSEMVVTESTPQAMSVTVGTGTALLNGITANVTTATTVPVDAASFIHIASESVDFTSGDTQILQTNGTPPHKIRSGTVAVVGYVEGLDFTIDYANGTITRLGTGSIPGGGTVTIAYDYFLPRIDLVQILMGNSQLQVIDGTPAQTPVPPNPSPNALPLATIYIGEGITIVVNSIITDGRVYAPTMDEIIAARTSLEGGSQATLGGRLDAHELRTITDATVVHGIRQGVGNGLDADKLDGFQTSVVPAANTILPLDANAKTALSTIPQGSGSGLAADTVDGYHASATPTAESLLPLNTAAQVPLTAIPQGIGSGLDADSLRGMLPSGNTGVIARMSDVQSTAVPPGTMVMWPGEAVPAGWVECDGRSRLRTNVVDNDGNNYYGIWLVTGIQWGTVDGNHFNLPDMRGVVPRGWNHSAPVPGLQTFTATTGQTIFILSSLTYFPGQNNLRVTVNGVVQELTHYVETNSTRITFNTAPGIGKTVVLQVLGYNDPDLTLRGAPRYPGGITGDRVGSFQEDTFGAHSHPDVQPSGNTAANGSNIPSAGGSANDTSPTGGNETRMRNAYVAFIIKL